MAATIKINCNNYPNCKHNANPNMNNLCMSCYEKKYGTILNEEDK